jgi:hypothetical protein
MGKSYSVVFDVVIKVDITVGARDEDEAYDRALEVLREGGEYDLIEIGEVLDSDIEEV